MMVVYDKQFEAEFGGSLFLVPLGAFGVTLHHRLLLALLLVEMTDSKVLQGLDVTAEAKLLLTVPAEDKQSGGGMNLKFIFATMLVSCFP